MAHETKKSDIYAYGAKGQEPGAPVRLRLAAIGFESEFTLLLDGRLVRPEDVFRDPRAFLRDVGFHRTGTSYSLPTGGAVYFDTGVIEVATPPIEIARGCAARAGRSLWEAILLVRDALDDWERRTRRDARLVGFSTHYNISFELPEAERGRARTVERLALLLTYLLPFPVMLLAANRRSSGVGVRPRGDRIEVTCDFTPSAALMIAAGAFITGVTREVMTWPHFGLEALAERGLPVVEGLAPMRHTSRKGWLARKDRFHRDPFGVHPDKPVWRLRPGYYEARGLTPEPRALRQIAAELFEAFDGAIRQVAEPATYRLIRRVMEGEAPSLLDMPDRPEAYEDVGRLCLWDNLFPERVLRRSQYERVLIRAIAGVPLRVGGRRLTPVGLRGWAEVVFRDDDGSRHAFSIDYLLDHLDRWERG